MQLYHICHHLPWELENQIWELCDVRGAPEPVPRSRTRPDSETIGEKEMSLGNVLKSPSLGVSIHEVPLNWMVYNGKSHLEVDDLGVPPF